MENDETRKSTQALQDLIRSRPEDFTETKKIIQNYFGHFVELIEGKNEESDSLSLEPPLDETDWVFLFRTPCYN